MLHHHTSAASVSALVIVIVSANAFAVSACCARTFGVGRREGWVWMGRRLGVVDVRFGTQCS